MKVRPLLEQLERPLTRCPGTLVSISEASSDDGATTVTGTLIDRGRAAGTWTLLLEPDDELCHVTHIEVTRRRRRGPGIGAAFVADLESALASVGCRTIHLHAVSGNGRTGAYFWARQDYAWDGQYEQLRIGREVANVDPQSELAKRLLDGDVTAAPRVVADDPCGRQVLLGDHLDFDDCISWLATKSLDAGAISRRFACTS
ncbi:MAG TPA: hypothetical protein PLS46_01900 [Microthrixaceae bacterium]|nr:hypothetical protein [Microthrixaceae bacterium]